MKKTNEIGTVGKVLSVVTSEVVRTIVVSTSDGNKHVLQYVRTPSDGPDDLYELRADPDASLDIRVAALLHLHGDSVEGL